MRASRVIAASLLASSLGLAACVAPAGVPYNPNPLPPPVRAETIPKPPPTEELLIWQPGHWDWTGSGYAWEAGLWIKREGHGTQWQDGYWKSTGTGWEWIKPHWV